MLGHHLQIENARVPDFGGTYDAARADAVVHGAPCLAQPGPRSYPFQWKATCRSISEHGSPAFRDLTAMRSLFAHRQQFAHDVRTLSRLLITRFVMDTGESMVCCSYI